MNERDQQHLTRAKNRWDRSRRATREARSDFHDVIRAAAAGGMSQAEIARVLGWPRQRVNTLLGED